MITYTVIASRRRGNPDYPSLEAWRVSDLICAWIATLEVRVRNDERDLSFSIYPAEGWWETRSDEKEVEEVLND